MRVFAIAVALGLAAPGFADVDVSEVERAAKSSLTPDFQDALPGHEAVKGDDGDGTIRLREPKQRPDRKQVERTPSERRIDTREYRERGSTENKAVGSLMTTVMWGLLAVALLLLVVWFSTEIRKSDKDVALPPEKQADEVAKQTAAIIDRPLGDADDLAARGEFARAIHTLLLRTLHELARSAMVRVEQSHTSREILARVPLQGDAREALSVLITYVELTHFGDDPAGPADYAKCREQFTRFATVFKAGLAIVKREPAPANAPGSAPTELAS